MTTHVVFPVDPESWLAATRAGNLLARQGYKVTWAGAAFSGVAAGKVVAFPAGSIVVEGAAVPNDLPGVVPVVVESLTLSTATPVRPIRIGVYGSGGAPYNHAAAFAAMGFLTEFLFAQDIIAGGLTGFDMLAVPGGGGRAMFGQLDPLGEVGCAAIRAFVEGGGMYLGSCAGAFDASLVEDSFVAACPQQKRLQMINAEVWNSGTVFMGLQSPGVGVLHAAVAAPQHPVTCGLPAELEVTHYNGPLYVLRQGTVAGASDAIGLTRVIGTANAFTPAENFLGEDQPRPDWLVSEAVVANAYNAVAGGFGRGRLVLFGSHPEFGLSLDLEAWDQPARLMANAGLWQAGFTGPDRAERVPARMAGIRVKAPWTTPADLVERVAAVAGAARSLSARDATGQDWLAATKAMSTFGESGSAIWERNLKGFDGVARRIGTVLAQLQAMAARAPAGPALDGVEQAIRFATPAEWNNDIGFEGVLQQLDRAERMLLKAGAGFGMMLPAFEDAYDHLDDSPFHLAVGSYLSASGVFGNVLLLLQMQKDRLENAIVASAPGHAAAVPVH